jgi:ABC-2 type transport system permease protein
MNAQPGTLSMHGPDARVLPAVWKLVLLRLRISYNSFRHAKLRGKIGRLVLYLMLLGFGYFVFWLSQLLLSAIHSPEFAQYSGIDLESVLASIPALVLSTLFFGILLTSFGVLLQALYLSGDMDFLLSTPVPIRAVFVAKLMQAVLPNFALTCLFGIPILFGLGVSSHFAIAYYPLVLLVMITLAFAAAGLASLLVMLVVRVMSPRRAAEILAFAGAMFGFLCSQMGNFANTLGKEIHISGTRLTGILLLANTRWLPFNWAGQGLVALGQSHWLVGLLLMGATLGFTIGVFWFALLTAEKWYYSGWAGMQVVARKKMPRPSRPANATTTNVGRQITRLFSSPVLGIIQKDFLTLRRDLRKLSQLISPIILGAMYTFSLLRGGDESTTGFGETPTWFAESFGVALTYLSVGMSLFVGWMLLSRLAGMGFSQEGRNYWVLKVAPVRTRQLIIAKFLVAYLPAVGLGLIFLLVISILQGFSTVEFFYSLVILVMCQAGATGILLAFGVAGANFTWDDPRKMNAGGAGCLGQIITMLYLPISFGLFVAPLGMAGFFGLPIFYGYLLGALIGSGITAACAFVPLWLVRKRAEQLGEE